MTEKVIPVEAVEAAAKAAWDRTHDMPWTAAAGGWRLPYLRDARLALEAAAPHMLTGDGDYRPGWDDRKTLASLWQEHAPLPAEGLSERVYEALIEIAAWGYQQRMDEQL